jgi:arylsulfatase A
VVCTIDLTTSLASHLGLSLPEESYIDSLDVMDALLGKEGAKGRDHLIQQDNGGKGNFGFRKGKWKLLRHAKKMARNVKVEEKLASENVDRLMLVDLEKDPGERKNLAKSNPEMTEKLNSELQALLDRGRSR